MVEFESPVGKKLGMIDGVCRHCGAPRKWEGWPGRPATFWLVCLASGLDAEDSPYQPCDLPTEEKARKRLAILDIKEV